MRIRTAGKGIVGAAAMVVTGWASVAFACSPMPRVYSVTPESAAPGSTVMVEGREIGSTSPVEIRWNGASGKVLATATAGADNSFSVPVRIPDVAPGVYALSLVTADAGIGRTAFEVSAAASSAPAAPSKLWLSGSGDVPVSDPASNGSATAGVALLGVGLVGLAAGATVAVTGRRRVRAESGQ